MREPVSMGTLLQALDARISRQADQPSSEISPGRWAYRMAAAVLVSFSLPTLRPLLDDSRDVAISSPLVLLGDVVDAPGGRADLLSTLKADVRREALARLGTRSRWRAALNANPERARDDFQQLFEAWLLGEPPALESQTYVALTQSAQVVSWLEGRIPDLPSATQLEALLGRRSVYSLFEHLATADFTDRESELTTLREFVGVLPPSSRRDAVARQIRSWLGLRKRPPLVIEGAGGVGKSALLGRFLVQHADVDAARRFPFAYLAFDSPSLKVEEPSTLIAEMARQLRLLYPGASASWEEFTRAMEQYRDSRNVLEERTTVSGGRRARTRRLDDTEATLYRRFSQIVSTVADRGQAQAPFLLVLDTFEEAQYRGGERLAGLMRMLDALDEHCPELRIVISMRPPRTVSLPWRWSDTEALTLTELPQEAAVGFLGKLGVTDRTLAEAVAHQVRGNPLNLRLAARLLHSEHGGGAGIEGLRTTSWLLFSVSDELIRGQLYARILSHIHDERVRRLAHPGMVLRRVTSEIILRVLREPCGVDVSTAEDAQDLLDELAREHTLVVYESSGILRYRPDIRVPTLKLLQQDRPQQVRQINMAAVAFYSRRTDWADRGEELYHRLALDQEASVLEERWDEKAREFLVESIDELPPRARTWLATRAGLDVPADVRARAALDDWERFVGRKIRDLLRYGNPRAAQDLLRERKERSPASPLFALEAKVCIFVGDLPAAQRILDRGIDSMSGAPNRGRMAELLWLKAQTLERERRWAEADRTLAQAEPIAGGIADRVCLLQILVQRLLLRKAEPSLPEPAMPLTERLAQAIGPMSESDMARERSLVRTAATLLGPSYSAVFEKVVRAVGLGDSTLEQRLALAGRLAEWSPPDEEVAMATKRVLVDLGSESLRLDQLVPELLQLRGAQAEVLAGLAHILAVQPHSLSAANLAGIDAYREPWELELPSEAA